MRGGLPFAVVLIGTVLAACASLPVKAVDNLDSVAGTWEGIGVGANGGAFPLTLVINEDGTYEASTPEVILKGTGKVWVKDGKIRFLTDPSAIGGTMTLHEGKGKRVLTGFADNGLTFKVNQGK